MSEIKMWLAVREDLAMPSGKLAAQSGHAFQWLTIHAMKHSPEVVEALTIYLKSSTPKIVVAVKNEEALHRVWHEAQLADIPVHLVRDEGRTVFPEPTYTVCAFGPCTREELTPFLRRLQILKDEI